MVGAVIAEGVGSWAMGAALGAGNLAVSGVGVGRATFLSTVFFEGAVIWGVGVFVDSVAGGDVGSWAMGAALGAGNLAVSGVGVGRTTFLSTVFFEGAVIWGVGVFVDSVAGGDVGS
ncbi:hypothetical protein NQX30_06530, partial [Candidatus Persebacteraceae bacterium Df01]|nr:hypothetical protein [Candidatus Persebacteraceae bacterium Df01]